MRINYEYENLKVIIDDKLRDEMDDQLILESDIKKVIGNAEKKYTKFFNPESGYFLAWRRLVNATFWVEYEKVEDAFNIINAYSHRINCNGEMTTMRKNNDSKKSKWLCSKCYSSLEECIIKVEYHEENFNMEFLECPICKNVLITEELATGKILKIEKSFKAK